MALLLMTWTCMVCGDERPDSYISVQSRGTKPDAPVQMRVNVRYCNDRIDCIEGALNHPAFAILEPGERDLTEPY